MAIGAGVSMRRGFGGGLTSCTGLLIWRPSKVYVVLDLEELENVIRLQSR